MNWLIRIGQWWERWRSIRADEFVSQLNAVKKNQFENMVDVWKRLEVLEQPKPIITKEMEIFAAAIHEIKKDLTIINARLNKIELYVGLNREPRPEQVPGASRIS